MYCPSGIETIYNLTQFNMFFQTIEITRHPNDIHFHQLSVSMNYIEINLNVSFLS